MMSATIKPVANQIEKHLYLQQPSLVEWCKKNGIIVMAYSPLGGSYTYGKGAEGEKFEHPLDNHVVKELATKKSCSPADVILAWHRERGPGYIVVTKSEKKDRLERALAVVEHGDVKLTDEEKELLAHEDKNIRLNDAAKVFWEIPSFE